MPYLTINEKDYYAKTNFKFERTANEKYSEKMDGNEVGGFMSIYLGLLQYSNEAILQFWDCALAHYKKDKPTLDEIEEALDKRIEEDGDTEKLLKEAFGVLDESGFFRKQVKSTWKELTAEQKPADDETPEEAKERKEQEQATEMLKKRRKELSTTKKS